MPRNHFEASLLDSERAGGVSLRIVTATTDLRTFAGTAPESDELLSFRRDIFVNRLFAPLVGQAALRVGGLQGSDSVSTRHPPLKPLPDPIPLKIRFPSSHGDAVERSIRRHLISGR